MPRAFPLADRYTALRAPALEALRRRRPVSQRRYTVEQDVTWLRGVLEPRWALRCYGRGLGVVCEGGRGFYPTEAAAHAKGARWVRTGLAPADQKEPAA